MTHDSTYTEPMDGRENAHAHKPYSVAQGARRTHNSRWAGMKRVHLCEFEDLPVFPSSIRNFMTDFLRHALTRAQVSDAALPVIKEVLDRSKTRRIVDLCSGSGGILVDILQRLNAEADHPCTVTYTDKFPNIPAMKKLCQETPHADYVAEPVDATDVPPALEGVRTMFLSFHHFRPRSAKAILKNAHDTEQPIAIVEVTERSLANLLLMAMGPIGAWALTPGIRPLTAKRLLFTYLLPVVPLCLMWDGIVSALRTYSPKELEDLVADLQSEKYRWEIGKKPAPHGYRITYLLGYPKS